jgi:DNA-binding response OmpR family regulator
MPLLDGFELAAALRNDHRTRQVPIVFLSGETGTASAMRANELGTLGHLSKPFDPAVVAAFIASVLGVAQAQP